MTYQDETEGRLSRLPKPEELASSLHKDSPVWYDPFLVALARTGNVTMAARAAGVSRRHVMEVRKRDTVFALAWEDAIEEAADLLEAEVHRRAVEGVDEPVYGRRYAQNEETGRSYQISDGQVGSIKRYSDTLLIFHLKGTRPQKYRDNVQQEHSGTVKIEYVNDWRGTKPVDGD